MGFAFEVAAQGSGTALNFAVGVGAGDQTNSGSGGSDARPKDGQNLSREHGRNRCPCRTVQHNTARRTCALLLPLTAWMSQGSAGSQQVRARVEVLLVQEMGSLLTIVNIKVKWWDGRSRPVGLRRTR